MDARPAVAWPLRLERRRVRRFFAGLLIAIGAMDVVEAMLIHHPLRDRTLEALLPTGITEGSRTGVVISGLVLLLLARGMARGKRAAWALNCAVLGGSAVLHLVKDLDIEQAVLAAWVLLGLWWLRPHFRAGSDPAALRRGAAALAAGIGLSALEAEAGSLLLRNELSPTVGVRRSLEQVALSWLGGSVYQPLSERAHWFLDSLPWVSGALVVIGLVQILRPVAARHGPTQAELARARDVALRWAHNPVSWLALSAGNAICWVGAECLVAYRVSGQMAVALGDPMGPAGGRSEAIEAFAEFCERRDWTPVFYQVESEQPYRRAGQTVLPVGSDAVVAVATFALDGPGRHDLRYAVRRCERSGITFDFEPAAVAWELAADELRAVTASWMTRGRGPELGFSLGRVENLDDREITVAMARTADGRLAAFTSWLPVPGRRGWTLDMMRRLPDAPYGVMEALIATSILEARRRDLTEVSLGLVLDLDLSGARPPAYAGGFYARLGRLDRNRSLRRFKEKFGPRWEPRYLAVPDPSALPAVLAALGRVHLPGLFRLSAVLARLQHEAARGAAGFQARPVGTGTARTTPSQTDQSVL